MANGAARGILTLMREDDFIDVTKIKDGGYGSIFRAKHRQLGYLAALKKVKTVDGFTDKRFRDDLAREIAILEHIRHPNIVSVFGYINEPSCIALVMELAEYGSLRDLLQLVQPEPLPLSIVIRMIHQVVLAMVFLHSQSPSILHLDLKILNVLVVSDFTAKVTDFGLSELRQYQQLHTAELVESKDAVARGTLTHVPPEKLMNLNIVPGKKYDVYGFAILAWELCSGKRAFDGIDKALVMEQVPKGQRPPMDQLHRDLPPAVRQLIHDCWHADLRKRPDFIVIKETTEKIVQHYASKFTADEIYLKNLIFQHQTGSRSVPSSSQQPVSAAPSEPIKAGSSTTYPKYVDNDVVEAEPCVDKATDMQPPHRSRKADSTGVERTTTTDALRTDMSALRIGSRTSSDADVSLISSGSKAALSSLQSDCATTRRSAGDIAAASMDGLRQPSQPSPPNMSHLSFCSDLRMDAEPPCSLTSPSDGYAALGQPTQGGGAGRVSGGAKRPGARTQTAQRGSSAGLAAPSRATTLVTPVSPLKGPHSQPVPVPGSQGYPHYAPHKDGFLYYPCPNVEPVVIPAVNGKVPPGMPAAGSLFPPGSSVSAGSQNVIVNKDGANTHIIQTGGYTSTQIGNKNIMYIGGGGGVVNSVHGPRPAPKPFDMSKVTKSKRKITDEDIHILVENVGSNWKELARRLGFTEGQVDIIHYDNATSLREQIHQMFVRFRNQHGDSATLDKVVAGLCAIKKPDIAALLPNDADRCDSTVLASTAPMARAATAASATNADATATVKVGETGSSNIGQVPSRSGDSSAVTSVVRSGPLSADKEKDSSS